MKEGIYRFFLTSGELEGSLWLEIKRLIKLDNKKGVPYGAS